MAHILLVEDDPNLLRNIANALRKAGHIVDEARTGRHAVLLRESCTPDLIVTDLNLPEMDGIEFILALRRIDTKTPILAISGGGLMPKESLLDTARLLGAVDGLSKPFGKVELLAAIGRALGDDTCDST